MGPDVERGSHSRKLLFPLSSCARARGRLQSFRRARTLPRARQAGTSPSTRPLAPVAQRQGRPVVAVAANALHRRRHERRAALTRAGSSRRLAPPLRPRDAQRLAQGQEAPRRGRRRGVRVRPVRPGARGGRASRGRPPLCALVRDGWARRWSSPRRPRRARRLGDPRPRDRRRRLSRANVRAGPPVDNGVALVVVLCLVESESLDVAHAPEHVVAFARARRAAGPTPPFDLGLSRALRHLHRARRVAQRHHGPLRRQAHVLRRVPVRPLPRRHARRVALPAALRRRPDPGRARHAVPLDGRPRDLQQEGDRVQHARPAVLRKGDVLGVPRADERHQARRRVRLVRLADVRGVQGAVARPLWAVRRERRRRGGGAARARHAVPPLPGLSARRRARHRLLPHGASLSLHLPRPSASSH